MQPLTKETYTANKRGNRACIFSYKQTEYYNGANKQFTVKWNDSRFIIHIPISNPILSERDKF